MALQIDLGLKSYDICDVDGGVVGTIRFNPSDMGMASRWTEAQERIQALTTTPCDSPEAMGALDREVKAQIDYAIGSPVSAVLFAGVSSVAMCVDGRMVLENVIDALTPIISEAMEAAVKASQIRVDKHAGKYQGSKAGLAPGQTLPDKA